MSQLTSRLLGSCNSLLGRNRIFAASVRCRRRSNQGWCFRSPAVVFASTALLLLIVGESFAGNTPIQNSNDDPKAELELLQKQEDELKTELAQRIKTANSLNSDPEIENLRKQLSEKLETKQALLSQLSLSAPDEPKYLYDLAVTHLAKSQLTMLEPATTEEESKARLRNSLRLKGRGIAIMKQIAPLDSPGLLDAHLFLAKSAIDSEVKLASEATESIKIAHAHLNFALIRDPKNQAALALKIRIANKTGQIEAAKDYLEKLFALDPFVYPQLCEINIKLDVPSQNVAVLHSAQQRLSEDISRMVGPSEQRIKYVTYLVDCLHRLDELDAADQQVENEIEKFSTDAIVQFWGKRLLAVGQALRFEAGLRQLNGKLDAKNAPELVGYLREGFRLDPNNVKLLNHIVGLRRYDVPGIEKISKDIYQPGSKSPASVDNLLGAIALSKGDYLEATKQFSKANVKAPSNAEYLNNLAFAYLTRPDPDPRKALKLVDKAIGYAESSKLKSRYLTNLYDTKGRVLLALGKIAEEAGDQELANRQYSAAAAKLQEALVDVDVDRPELTPLEREAQRKRSLAISQAVVECYEAADQPRQTKIWKDRVKQLQASENENETEQVK